MSIRLKLILGALAFLLLIVAVFVATRSVTSEQKSDGLVINLAGRQRMLAERMTKELLEYIESGDNDAWQDFGSTKMTFEATHRALRKGGAAPTGLLEAQLNDMGEIIELEAGKLPENTPTASLPAATDTLVKKRLESVDALYGTFVEASNEAEKQARLARDQGDMVVFQIPQLQARLLEAVERAQKAGQSEILDDDSKAELLKVVRYASRQRLLAQQLGTLALNYLRSPTMDAGTELTAAMSLFENTHSALVEGGAVAIDMEDPEETELIGAAPDRRFQERMADVTDTWTDLDQSIKRMKAGADAKAAALHRALEQAPEIGLAMRDVVTRAQELSEKRVATVQTVQIIALLVGLIFVIIAAVMGSGIGKRLADAVAVAKTIAAGDLTTRCEGTGSDESGQLMASLNTMTENLADLVQRVQYSGSSVGSSSGQIATSARRQESAVSELAATSTQIAATSSEISATAGELLDTMSRVGQVSGKTATAAGEGKQSLDEMRRRMAHMVESTSSVSEHLAAINQKTAKISTVVTTIMKIAQQTNLISLNAAIEAENAGELGLGFAVVAKEVRRLADQTSKASKGIEQMVSEMQTAVATAVMGMDGFSDDIRNGSDSVQTVAGQLGGIIDEIEDLVPQFETVREGMSAQATGAIQIADGVRQIVASSEETAESVRETTAAIDALSLAATQLQEGVSRFKLSENGQ